MFEPFSLDREEPLFNVFFILLPVDLQILTLEDRLPYLQPFVRDYVRLRVIDHSVVARSPLLVAHHDPAAAVARLSHAVEDRGGMIAQQSRRAAGPALPLS